MRKLETRAERDKKSQRNMLLVGGLLIGMMVLGTLALAFSTKSRYDDQTIEKTEYNNVMFYKRSGLWVFEVDKQMFETRYDPSEVGDIKIANHHKLRDYNDQIIYFVGEGSDAYIEIIKNLIDFIKRQQPACLSDEDCEGDYPIKNCSTDYVLIIKNPGENETENFYQDEKCTFIIANYENQTRYADAFLFDMLEIT